MVNELIASDPISLLLRKLSNKDEESARYNEMLHIFKNAAEMSVVHAAERGHEEFLRGLENYNETFTEGSNNMVALHSHCLDDGDTRLDGRRVLLVVRPVIFSKFYHITADNRPFMLTKAEVLVEDSEEGVKDGDE